MRPRLSYLAILLAVTAVYLGAAKLGLMLAFWEAEQVSPVWPPTGIALAAILLLGYRVWPAIALGAFLANATANEPVGTAGLIAAGNTLEAVTGAWLLRRFVAFNPSLDRVKDVLGLALFGAGVGTIVSASIGVASLCLSDLQLWAHFGKLWRVWWLGDAVGALVAAPPLLTWASWRGSRWRPERVLEMIALLLVATAVSLVVFDGWFPSIATDHPLEFAVFPVVIWAALRFGPSGAAVVALLFSSLAVWGAAHHYGPFTARPVHEGLVLLQIFLGMVAVTGLVLAAAMRERDTAERRRAAIYAVTQVLTESAPVPEAASHILRTVCESLDWDVGNFWRLDGSVPRLRCVASWGKSIAGLAPFQGISCQKLFTPGEGLPGRVFSSGQPAWIADVQRDLNFPRALFAAQAGLHGAFGFPVRLGDDVVGVVEFFSREVRAPSPDLLRLMSTLGDQIGVYIQRKQAEEALIEADRRKDRFLAMLAHELRNPLAPIRNAVQILRLIGTKNGELDWACGVVDRQSLHLSRLVDDLLDVSRIRSGKVQIHREPLDLAQLVRTTAEDRRATLEQAGLQLSVLVPGAPVWVAGDATRLAQALNNLLDNASKFQDGGTHIAVRLEVDSSRAQAVLAVRDQGIGIEPALLPQLFDTFAQLDRSLDRSRGGLGLGLSLVRGLVELHGGTVQAASDGPGKGAEFTIRLPLKTEAPTLSSQAPGALPAAERPLRILVVEDNHDAAESLRILLQLLGHEATVATTGPEGVRLARDAQADVVICDIGLPGLDGYGVARALRHDPATAKALLIALTGYGQDEDRERSRRSGFDHHLVKPVHPLEIQKLLVERTPTPMAALPS